MSFFFVRPGCSISDLLPFEQGTKSINHMRCTTYGDMDVFSFSSLRRDPMTPSRGIATFVSMSKSAFLTRRGDARCSSRFSSVVHFLEAESELYASSPMYLPLVRSQGFSKGTDCEGRCVWRPILLLVRRGTKEDSDLTAFAAS